MKFQNKMKLGVFIFCLLLLFTTSISLINFEKGNKIFDESGLSLSAPDDPYEPNNNASWAFDLTSLENTWLSSFDQPAIQSDMDWYNITILSGKERLIVKLLFWHFEDNIDIKVLDIALNPIVNSTTFTDNEYIDYILPIPGLYHLVVYGNDTGAKYDLLWSSINPASPDDFYEPNDILTNATDISFLNNTWLSSFNGLGIKANDDWYEIFVPTGFEHLIVELIFCHAVGDIDIEIWDNIGPIPGAFSNGVNDNEFIDIILPSGGVYYIHIYLNNFGNTYDLRWTAFPQVDDGWEENDDYFSSKYIDPNYYFDLRIVGIDQDWFHIYLNPGDTLDVDIYFNQTEGDLDLELWDPSYNPRIGSYFNPNNEFISFTADMSGDWRIRVYHKYGNSSVYYDLDIWLNAGDDYMEENDDFGSAWPVGPNWYPNLKIIGSDEDWFRFYLNTGDSINIYIDFAHMEGNLQLELYDPSYIFRAGSYSSTDDKESISYPANVSGEWRIRVYHEYGDSDVHYNLDIWLDIIGPTDDYMEENDGFWSAWPVGPNWYPDLKIVESDEDWFQIYLDPGDVIDVSIHFNHKEGDLQLELYDPSYTYRTGSYSSADYDYTGFNFEKISYLVDVPGDWRIRVYHEYGDSEVHYDLGIQIKDDYYEFNNYFDEAYFLDERIWLSDLHGLAVFNDDDWYMIEITPGFLNLIVDLRFNNSIGNLSISIQDEWNSWSIYDNSLYGDGSNYINCTVPHPGWYYLLIQGDFNENKYDLWWDDLKTLFSDDPYEPNDDFGNAYDITSYEYNWLSHDWINGLGVQYDNDFYMIIVKSGFQQLEVTLFYDYAEGPLGIEIYNWNFNKITQNFTTSDHEFIDCKLPSNGTYYIKIFGDLSGNVYNLYWATWEYSEKGMIPGYDVLILLSSIVGVATLITVKWKRSEKEQ